MNPDAKPRYRAFVSYSHADRKWAQWLQRELESYRIPKRIQSEYGLAANALRPVFRDSDELGSTPDLSEALQEALTASEALIVVCSRSAGGSDWVDREIEYFLALAPERARRVFCLLVDGDATDDIRTILPRALAGYEGLAADLRKGGDGPKRAKMKLISALTGVNLDRLIQRDRAKRRQRASVLAAIAAVVTLVIAALAIQSRMSALKAEEKARAADELVTYMLADLNKRLDEFDGVANLDSGFNAALAYFEGLETEDMSDETMARYFDALTSAGDLRLREGNGEAALRIWKLSSEISERLIERDAGNADSWRRHGDSFISLALAQWEDPEQIVLNTKQAMEFFERAAELDPENFSNQGIQVATLNNMGAGYTRLRDFDSAREAFVRSLTMNESLRSGSWPESADVVDRMLRQEAESAAWLTEVELHLGQVEAAIDWHEREITIRREELSGGNPVRLGDALRWGAVAYESIGDDLTARSKRTEATQLFEDLMQQDPDNFYWQRRYIESVLRRTTGDIHLGNEAVAQQTLADVEQRLDALGSRHPDNIDVIRMLARMDLVHAQLWVDSSSSKTLEYATRAMSRLRPQVQEAGASFETLLLHAEAAAFAAYAMITAGEETRARELALAETGLLEQNSGGSDFLPDKQVEVILLWLAGEHLKAEAIISKMREAGYRSSSVDRWQERLQLK
jgi:tetratricopeptide (TPR) repeat protein